MDWRISVSYTHLEIREGACLGGGCRVGAWNGDLPIGRLPGRGARDEGRFGGGPFGEVARGCHDGRGAEERDDSIAIGAPDVWDLSLIHI